jgi:hypothetical protein
MTIEQLRKAHQARPFKPFVLRTADGREYRVPHPEVLLITPSGRTVIVADTDDTVELIDLLLVASLHFNNARPRTGHRKAS